MEDVDAKYNIDGVPRFVERANVFRKASNWHGHTSYVGPQVDDVLLEHQEENIVHVIG